MKKVSICARLPVRPVLAAVLAAPLLGGVHT